MKLYELRDYINNTAYSGVIYQFCDIDEPSYTTGDYSYILGEIIKPGFVFGKSITLLFYPSDAPGIPLTREGLLEWLNAIAYEYGDETRVKIRLYDPSNLSDTEYRDMFTDKLWGKIYTVNDGIYRLTDGGSKAPYEPSSEQLSRFVGTC